MPEKRKADNDIQESTKWYKRHNDEPNDIGEYIPKYSCVVCGIRNLSSIKQACMYCISQGLATLCQGKMHWVPIHKKDNKCITCEINKPYKKNERLCKGQDCDTYIYFSKNVTDYCDTCRPYYCCDICNTDEEVQVYPYDNDPNYSNILYCNKCITPFNEFMTNTCEEPSCIFAKLKGGYNYCAYHRCYSCLGCKTSNLYMKNSMCDRCENQWYDDLLGIDDLDISSEEESTNKRKIEEDDNSVSKKIKKD